MPIKIYGPYCKHVEDFYPQFTVILVMIDVQTILTYLTLISVPIGVTYHIVTLYNSRKNQQLTLETRQAQLFMNIFNNFSSKEYQKDLENIMSWQYTDYDDFFAKYGPDVNPDDHAIWDHNLQWMEGLGVMVKRNLIDPNLVYDIMYGTIISFYEKFEPIILRFKEQGGTHILQDLTYIHDEMKRIQKERGIEHQKFNQ
jgi:hypothetical protein